MSTRSAKQKPQPSKPPKPRISKGARLLAAYCEAHGQRDVARIIGTGQGLISRFVNGKGKPGLKNAMGLAGPPINIPLTAWTDYS